MDNGLVRSLNKLLRLTDDFETLMYGPLFTQEQDFKRRIADCFTDLMSHLRRIMIGYENEEVQGLFKDMEPEVDRMYAPRVFKVSSILESCKELCSIRYGSTVETLLSSEDTMVGDLDAFLEKLTSHIEDYEGKRYHFLSAEALERKRRVSESFEALMNHLTKMMIGYENERVQGLFEEMERNVARHFFRLSLSDMILRTCRNLFNIRYGSNLVGEEIVTDFDEEVEILLDQLTSTSTNQLQIISIAGMAGLGKTTLAGKLYRDPLLEYVFDILAWICVSQEYQKSSFINDLTDEMNE